MAPGDDHICKRTCNNTAATSSTRKRSVWSNHGGSFGGIVQAIAAQTERASIEEGTSREVVGPERPIPIWKGAVVTAFINESLFQEMDEVAMPS